MKILIVTNQYPYPLHNGQNLRIYHYARHLCERHDIDMICYGNEDDKRQGGEYFNNIVFFEKPIYKKTDKRRIRDIIASFSLKEMLPSDEKVKWYIKKVIKSKPYDLIWMSGWDMASSIPHELPVPFLADIVDDGVLEHARELKNASSIKSFVIMAKRLLMNFFLERRYFCRADRVLLVSEVDSKWFSTVCPKTDVSVVHNGVDEDYYRPLCIEEENNTIIFEGSMDFRPNVDGVIYFCREILPLIIKEKPQTKFYIVGKNPVPEVKSLSSDKIIVTGFVDDVRPYIARSNVFVCPLRKGAGIKNKILQAWSMGKAVVATSASVGGLATETDKNIIIQDQPELFAREVVSLLDDQYKREKIGQEARSTILSKYTWRIKSMELEDVMISLLNSTRS